MIWRLCGVLLGLSLAAQAMADSLDVNIHDNALRVTYATALGAPERGLQLDGGYLYAKNPGESDHLLHVGLQVAGQNWSNAGTFDIGVGGRLIYADTKPGNALDLAFGGHVRFSPINRIGIGGQIFYAPKITSTLDSEEYTEWRVTADYQLLTQAFVYVGYRHVETKFKNKGTYVLDDNLNLGMKLLF